MMTADELLMFLKNEFGRDIVYDLMIGEGSKITNTNYRRLFIYSYDKENVGALQNLLVDVGNITDIRYVGKVEIVVE